MQIHWRTTAILGALMLLVACGGGSTDSGTAVENPPVSSPSSVSPPPVNSPAAKPAATYQVQLNWSVPSTRANGSPLPLSELAGYRVYYLLEGTDSSNDSSVSVSGGTVTSLNLTLTAAGSYTFAITAVDQNGVESSLSKTVSATIN